MPAPLPSSACSAPAKTLGTTETPGAPLQAQSSRALTLAWLVLLAITATTWWMGGGRVRAATGSMVPVLVLCGLTFVKGLLVSLEFLELRHAPALWRWLVCGWLTLVLLLIALAFWVSRW